ncbi:acetate--CoA ligase family protein [Ornithinimicrobium sp. F0845]|uniref:acetate--CoA ligase family protein n=1 Tax=Ornithinimicrobium sp. F0845 TaxID=2926412 RepID=UPI001FF5E468|nr:acetate--CoA ligase family protein [Ornithinimicrobium sp. F0845]MCK0112018.1 acetate--CoA ligase family protein [Ornithinimicrobium sp. F0845]
MTVPDLDPLLRPRSVAVVGASLTNPTNVGSRTLHQLRRFFPGRTYLVHPRATGDGTATDLASLPETVDLLVVAVPAPAVVPVVAEGARAGIRAALIFTSGFAEGGADGAAAQEELQRISAETGMLINGPNTIGYMNLHDGILATFFLPQDIELPAAGPVAVVSQSGALATYVDELARDRGITPGWLVTTGNEAGVTVTDCLAYLIERPEVTVLAATSEGMRDPQAFVHVASRAAQLGKPFVFVKAGRSAAGMAAAQSHTASISGGDDVFDAVCRQYGVLRADSLEEALDWLSVFQTQRRLAGNRIGLLTGSGGGGVMMADVAHDVGLEVATTPETDQALIEQWIPSFGSAVNPVDVTAQAIASGVGNYQRILRALVDSTGFDCVAVGSGLRGPQAVEVAEKIAATYVEADKPLVLTWYSTNQDSRRLLVDVGVPTYQDSSRAIGALGALRRFQEQQANITAEPVRTPDPDRAARARTLLGGEPTLTEAGAKTLLGLYGLQVVQESAVTTVEAAVQAAETMAAYPVAVKVLSPDLPHKSDVGGVHLGVADGAGVRDAGEAILAAVAEHRPNARIEGLVVQQMAPSGVELVCGVHRDPIFGPVVTVGLGGVLVEVVADVALCKAPLTMEQARAALAEVADGRLVSHSRGITGEQADAIAEIMVSLGDLAVELPEVAEIDVNPLIVSSSTILVADALVGLA